jgi:hypothetical protein
MGGWLVTTPSEALALLNKMNPRLTAQAADVRKWRDYYDGKQPLKFASGEWRTWFGKQYEGFADNWCAPVVDATAERIRWTGFRPYEAKLADADLSRVMSVNSADTDSGLAFTEAQYGRRAFCSVWGNPDDEATPLVTFESPEQVYVLYEAGSRRKRRAALKRWQDDDGRTYATLYTADAIFKYTASGLGANSTLILPPGLVFGWEQRQDDGDATWPLPNPMGVVPIVELPNRTSLTGEPISSISGVAAMQDAINLLWAHLFTASDFAALPQKVILGAVLPKMPVLDSDGQKIGEKPIELSEANFKRIMNIEGPEAKIDSWPAANLAVFTEVIGIMVGHITNQTRTPAYYLMTGGTFSNIGGDGITALDAPLNAKVANIKAITSDPMREVGRLICLAQGDERKAAAMSAGSVLWADHEIRSDTQLADSLTKYTSIGFPFSWVAKQKISDPDELAEVIRDYEKQHADPYAAVIAEKDAAEVPDAEPSPVG